MSNEIYHSYDEGATLYALIWRKSDDKVYDVENDAFDTYTDADIDDYNIDLANIVDSDYYSVDFPAAITTAGIYRVQVMLQASGAIDADDDVAIAQGEICWDGTEEITLSMLTDRQSLVYNEYDERTSVDTTEEEVNA